MSVYKNAAARQRMQGWYQYFLDSLEHPTRSTWVETEAGRTHVLRCGAPGAPKLLCLHGAMGSAASALSLIQPLVPHVDLYFPDTVGQPGRSAETSLPLRGPAYGRWATQVMDGLELPRAMLLGVSMGGFIAGKLAQQAPERIERMSLWVPGGLVTSGLLPGLRLGLRSLLLYLFPSEARMEALYDELFTDRDETWFRFYSDSLSSLQMERRMPQLAPDDAYEDLEAPVQLLANAEDVIFPPEALLARGRQLFPNLVDSAVLGGFRHVPPLQPGATDAALARVRDFLLGRLD